MNFNKYKLWAHSQTCIDCGEKATEKTGLWVTETQCLKCWSKLGCPETRGLPSTKQLASKSGIYV